MKTTQMNVGDVNSKIRGRAKQIYIKSDIEEKADEFCKKHNISFSLLVRMALEGMLDKDKRGESHAR